MFQESVRRFMDKEIVPNIEKWDEEHGIPRSVWKKMGDQGFLNPCITEEYGGTGADFSYSIVVQEELAYSTCMSLATGIGVHSDIVTPYVAKLASEELKDEILPGCFTGDTILAIGMTEPNAGSDLANLSTKAEKKGNDYVINGQKTFISNGINCDWVVLAVRTDAAVQPAYRGVSLILVPSSAPGFTKGRRLNKMGLYAQDTAELIFEDCRVPLTNIMGEEGKGFKYLMQNLQRERLLSCIGAPVIAKRMLEMTIEYAKSRMAFGKPISSFQFNSFRIAEMATEVELGHTYVDSLIGDYLSGNDITMRVSMGKWWLTEMINRVANQCVQLHGGYGYMEEYSICRLYRDLRCQTIAAGSTEIMKHIIAGALDL
jgi:acyl-CoA dehydrogenase